MPSTPTLHPVAAEQAPQAGARRRHVGPIAAAITFALAVTGTAYLVRGDNPAATSAPYREYALSDAQDVLTPPQAVTGPVGIPLANGATEATIGRLETAAATTQSPGLLSLIARLLMQRAAVTGDSDTYARATSALDRALGEAPDDLGLRAQRASARLIVHDFAGAAADADQVLAARPEDPGALAAAFDAAFETGRYAFAEARLAQLTRLAPDAPPVLFRQARWAALNGDSASAASLAARARAAADTDGAVGTARATYDLLSGKLALDEGRYAVAIGAYESALQWAPAWHAALAGLGRARAASGDLVGAEAALSLAADIVPLPDTLSALGDVRTALGDATGAETAYGTIDVVARLEAVQQRSSRAIALSRADRGVDTAAAVRDARSEFEVRRDVYGSDALGWALLSDGKAREAVRYADASLALGTRDPRLLAHAGLAHAAAGDVERARDLLAQAMALSPNVDPLLMDRVRNALAALPAGQAS